MMTKLQLLLTKLAEEASEVSQIALKAQQFGLHEVRPDQPYTNAELAHQELDDLMAVVAMLNDQFSFGYEPDGGRIKTKIAKIIQYADKSVELGQVKRY